MIGPVMGSSLVNILGGFAKGIAVLNIAVLLLTLATTYHLAGDVLFYAKLNLSPDLSGARYASREERYDGDYVKLEDDAEKFPDSNDEMNKVSTLPFLLLLNTVALTLSYINNYIVIQPSYQR